MSFLETFRALSRQMREERGLELYDIAHHVRKSESSVSKWETGDTLQPDGLDSWLDGYAAAFGIPTIELVQEIARRMGDDEAAAVEREIKAAARAPRQSTGSTASGAGAKRPGRRASGAGSRP